MDKIDKCKLCKNIVNKNNEVINKSIDILLYSIEDMIEYTEYICLLCSDEYFSKLSMYDYMKYCVYKKVKPKKKIINNIKKNQLQNI